MSDATIFWIAFQSSLFLGLIHGINPCGHSWVVLAPFVAGDSSGRRVARLTLAFILGTAVGCLAIAVALGALSVGLPDSVRQAVDLGTACIIMGLGLVMLIKPNLLHHHDHHHDHCPDHTTPCLNNRNTRVATAWGLVLLGFVNVIVPCPTLAMMYSYAIDSTSIPRAVGVFTA
ncbi:MAG: sulfite exporter TauE/SafE family protein, partial [Desulfovibrio sp.]